MTENKISNKDKENKKHHFNFNSSDLMSDKDKTPPAYQLVKDIVFYVFLLLLALIIAIYNKPSAFKFSNNTNEANQAIKVSKNYNTELDSAIEKIKDGYTLVYATDPQTGAECYVTKSGINYRLNEQGKPVINKKYVITKTDFKSR